MLNLSTRSESLIFLETKVRDKGCEGEIGRSIGRRREKLGKIRALKKKKKKRRKSKSLETDQGQVVASEQYRRSRGGSTLSFAVD